MLKDFSKFYLDYLETNLSGLNLTRITKYDEFYEKQVLDSIIPFQKDSEVSYIANSQKLVVDLGFGGGFPILALREILGNEIRLVGIESRKKKVNAVSAISNSYGQKNIYFVHSRIEDVIIDEKCLITLKAVGDIKKMLSKINCIEGSYVLFYKGKNLDTLEPKYEVCPGFKFVKRTKFQIGDNERSVVLYEKLKITKNHKTLVKLSDLVFNK